MAVPDIAGVTAARVERPASVAEAREILVASARAKEVLAIVGGGTELELGAAPERLDLVVATAGLDRLVEHAPADQIVQVEAGMTLATLQAHLGQHRQRLALDPPWPARATIGGLIATNASGPLRTRYGSIRDLIIGISVLRVDGTPAKGGGKVVKNVAGFDLPKLMVGSLGTLAMITSATFRLHPLPATETTLCLAPTSADALFSWAQRFRQAQLEPSALAVLDEGERFVLAVRYEGFAAGVAQQRDQTLALARGEAAEWRVLDEAAGQELWHGERALREAGPVRLKLTAVPAELSRVAGQLWPRLRSRLVGARWCWYPLVGVGFVTARALADLEALVVAVAEARAILGERGGALVVSAAPPELRARLDVWGPPPSSLPLHARMKARFDPERRLNRGRFVGGL
jgi:glycolate oxidase FAD binding subunit